MNKYRKSGMIVLVVAVIMFFLAVLGGFGNKNNNSDIKRSNSSQSGNTNTLQGTWLTDIKYSDADLRVYINKTYMDSGGTGYKHYLTGSGRITYPLHRLYSSLSGRWEVNINENNCMAKPGALCIYADERLVYSSSSVSIADNLYEDVFIDLSDCDQLRIELNPTDGHWCIFHNVWLEPYSNASGNPPVEAKIESNNTNMNQPSSLSIRNVPAYIDCIDRKGYSITDQFGNEHNDCFDLIAYNDKSDNRLHESSITLRPLGNWHYLRGKYFTDPYQNEGFLIRFLIFADNILIYDSGMIDRNVGPIDFDLDINYANTVILQSHSDDYTFMGSNASIMLADTEVYN